MTGRESIAVRERARPPAAAARLERRDGAGDGAPAIDVRGLSKRFRIPDERMTTLKERALHPRSWRSGRELTALREVSFEVPQGEFFSIIGRNGSGKSTLLKCLAGVYLPDAGEIGVRGRVSPFIELGVGFNDDLNAFDNVLLNATLIGLSPQEARRRFPSIVEFAELEDFVDMKLRNYSTGMQMRLGFATAIQVDADVLLVDEVLAVGDAPFRRKCIDTFRRLKREGCTIVFVSHDTGLVQQLSDRVMVLNGGEVVTIDRSPQALEAYQRLNTREKIERRDISSMTQFGDGSAHLLDLWFEGDGGGRVERLERGEAVAVKLKASFLEDMEAPVIGVSLMTELGGTVLTVHNKMEDAEIFDTKAGDTRTFVARFRNWLGAGTYFAIPFVLHEDGRSAAVIERALTVPVETSVPGTDAVLPPTEIEVLAE
jgi:ABC-type polysaccharide/polyol phosphate transport system ATPase subunit